MYRILLLLLIVWGCAQEGKKESASYNATVGNGDASPALAKKDAHALDLVSFGYDATHPSPSITRALLTPPTDLSLMEYTSEDSDGSPLNKYLILNYNLPDTAATVGGTGSSPTYNTFAIVGIVNPGAAVNIAVDGNGVPTTGFDAKYSLESHEPSTNYDLYYFRTGVPIPISPAPAGAVSTNYSIYVYPCVRPLMITPHALNCGTPAHATYPAPAVITMDATKTAKATAEAATYTSYLTALSASIDAIALTQNKAQTLVTDYNSCKSDGAGEINNPADQLGNQYNLAAQQPTIDRFAMNTEDTILAYLLTNVNSSRELQSLGVATHDTTPGATVDNTDNSNAKLFEGLFGVALVAGVGGIGYVAYRAGWLDRLKFWGPKPAPLAAASAAVGATAQLSHPAPAPGKMQPLPAAATVKKVGVPVQDAEVAKDFEESQHLMRGGMRAGAVALLDNCALTEGAIKDYMDSYRTTQSKVAELFSAQQKLNQDITFYASFAADRLPGQADFATRSYSSCPNNLDVRSFIRTSLNAAGAKLEQDNWQQDDTTKIIADWQVGVYGIDQTIVPSSLLTHATKLLAVDAGCDDQVSTNTNGYFHWTGGWSSGVQKGLFNCLYGSILAANNTPTFSFKATIAPTDNFHFTSLDDFTKNWKYNSTSFGNNVAYCGNYSYGSTNTHSMSECNFKVTTISTGFSNALTECPATFTAIPPTQ